MAASTAQIHANRQNAAKSTGPRTESGKDASKRNALKHGQTGAGVVVPVEDQGEVEQRVAEFTAELQPSGSLGLTLIRRAATMAVRMERAAERELARVAERVVQALAEFEAPAGVDEAEAARLRVEAARLAAFDPSKEACLARRYEAAAERSFFRALKEFRLVEKQPQKIDPAVQAAVFRQELGSFLHQSRFAETIEADDPELPLSNPRAPFDPGKSAPTPRPGGRFDVPITIGHGR